MPNDVPKASPALQRFEIRFVGRVQGVFFRKSTERLARGFAVTGWVRNEPDGSVRMQTQGTPAEIERFLAHHREHRPGRVDQEERHEIEISGNETRFEVRR